MPELSYAEVGATDGVLPLGYRHQRITRELGVGRDVFDCAKKALLTWEMHSRAGVRIISAPKRVVPDVDVRFSWHGLRFDCRVIKVVDEPNMCGFTYGTLPRHPECGEERFAVELERETQLVTATIVAFSKPAGPLTRAIGPVGRLIQRRVTNRYLASLYSGRRSAH